MHDNFKRILWLCGHFGIVIREHAEKLVYKGTYGKISANTTFAKLEREYGLLKRIDRGKRKSDAYRLTHEGILQFRKIFGYEPKFYNSTDKLAHSIQILNFYSIIYNDAVRRGLIDKISIREDKKIINFNVHREINFSYKNKNQTVISDGFCIYRYEPNKGIVFYVEIENSDRKSSAIARKTIENYEGYYISGKWKEELWQPKNIKIFPVILIVTYSEWKMKELIRHFRERISIDLKYYFSYYNLLDKNGFSGDSWFDINNKQINLI